MAYSNVTPPTLPEYDAAANPYYLIQFEYAIGAENWETVRFWYGAAPLTWNGEAVTNSADSYCQTYGTGSPEWTAWGVMAAAGEMALAPGVTTADTYMRLYTNHDILDGTGAVWLEEGTVTPTEEDKEAEIQIRKKSQLAGIIAAWCAPVRQSPKPTAEPVAFLYNGVRLPGLPEWDKEKYPYAHIIKIAWEEMNYYKTALCVSETPTYEKMQSGAWDIFHDGSFLYGEDGCWKSFDEEGGNYDILHVIWANFNVLNEDGSVYLKASDPLPVYE